MISGESVILAIVWGLLIAGLLVISMLGTRLSRRAERHADEAEEREARIAQQVRGNRIRWRRTLYRYNRAKREWEARRLD